MRKTLGMSAIVVTTVTGIAILTTQSNAGPPPVSAPNSKQVEASGDLLSSMPPPEQELARAPRGTARVVSKTVNRVPVSAADPQQGPSDALVTLVIFGDFQDKFTRRAADTIDALQQKYGSELRVVWKNAPLSFHEDARPAATLAMEAFRQGGNALFWRAHTVLLEHQSALGTADLLRYASELGLKSKPTQDALAHDKYRAKLEADLALAPRLFPVLTTPLSTINGRFILGAESQSVFASTIEEERSRAHAKLAEGTSKEQLYEELTKDGNVAPAQLTTEQQAAADKVYDVPVPKDAATMGGAHAKVVIQVFSDFQCPFCAQAESVMRSLRREYKDQVQFVWRDFPLAVHPDAELAAEAAREVLHQAQDAKFWAYHDLLFAHQSALSRPDLERYAEQLGGLDMAKFRSALEHRTNESRVRQDVASYSSSGSHQGSPGFFVNGKLIEGAMPIEVFRSAINQELALK